MVNVIKGVSAQFLFPGDGRGRQALNRVTPDTAGRSFQSLLQPAHESTVVFRVDHLTDLYRPTKELMAAVPIHVA